MHDNVLDAATAFLEGALEGAHLFNRGWFDSQLDPSSWHPAGPQKLRIELRKKHLMVPSLPKAGMQPCALHSPWDPEDRPYVEAMLGNIRKRDIFKASLYRSSNYDLVASFLVSIDDQKRQKIQHRFEIAVQGDTFKLANTWQLLCYNCFGASAVPGNSCPECVEGFLPERPNDVALQGLPVLVRRLASPDSGFEVLMDAEL